MTFFEKKKYFYRYDNLDVNNLMVEATNGSAIIMESDLKMPSYPLPQ